MADAASIFPVYFQTRYDSGSSGLQDFKRDAAAAGTAAGDSLARNFRASAGELRKVLDQALSGASGSSPAIDLGVPQMREAAQAAEARAAALRQTAAAAAALAAGERELSAAEQAVFATIQASLGAAENDVATKREQLTVYEQLQVQLNEMAAATGRNNTATRASAATAGAAQIAQFELLHVIRSSADAFAAGQSASRIFAMEIGRVAEAAAIMGPSLGRVGAFLSGGWGLALTAGISLLSIFATRSSAAETSQLSLADASNTLGHAQSLLGNLVDLATGRITNQNTVVREAIRLQAILAQIEANRAGQAAGARLGAMAPDRYIDARGRGVSLSTAAQASVFGDGSDISGSSATAGLQSNPGADAFQVLVAQFRGNANADVRQFRERLETLRAQGQLPGLDVNAAVAEALRVASGRQEISTMRDVQRVAEGAQVPGYLLRSRGGGGHAGGAGGGRAAPDQTEFGEDAGKRIANIAGRFAGAPSQVEAVRRAMGELNDVATDIERRHPPNYDALLVQLREAKATVQDGLLEPYRKFLQDQDDQLKVQRLIDAGRATEADSLQAIMRIEQQTGKLDDEQRAAITRRVELRAEEARQAEILQQRQQAYNQAIDQMRSTLESTLASINTRGLHAIGDLASGLTQTFRQLSAQTIVEQLFGSTFRDLQDFVSGRARVRQANEAQADASDKATRAIDRLADSATNAANAVTGAGQGKGLTAKGGPLAEPAQSPLAVWDNAGSGPDWRGTVDLGSFSTELDRAFASITQRITAANDDKPIVVTAHRPPPDEKSAGGDRPDLTAYGLIEQGFQGMLMRVFHNARLAESLANTLAQAVEGATYGQMGGGLLLGSGGNRSAEALGGALGDIAGSKLGKALGNSLGGFASFLGPLGGIAGGVLGGLVGGLFKPPPPTGTAVISSYSGAPSVSGNNSGAQQQASDMADSVQQALRNIAQQLGGTIVDGGGRVAIGTYNGTVRVSPSGGPIHGRNTDSINYGTDTAAAVKAATLNLIQDGMIAGLRASTQRLLAAAKDLNTGLQNALDFEGVFTELKQHLDPVGAAIDALDKRFEHLKELFKEAGASTEEYAQLEQLYQLDRKDAITQAGQQLTSALKSLLDDLTTNNQALSLRDRLASAHATYDPLAAKVAAGDTSVSYDDFAAAARALLDIQRQISGSNQPYFDLLAQVQELTKATLDHQQSQIDAASAAATPFTTAVDAGADQTVSAIDRLGSYLGGILSDQLGSQLAVANDNLGTMIGLMAAQGGGGGSSSGYDPRYNF